MASVTKPGGRKPASHTSKRAAKLRKKPSEKKGADKRAPSKEANAAQAVEKNTKPSTEKAQSVDREASTFSGPEDRSLNGQSLGEADSPGPTEGTVYVDGKPEKVTMRRLRSGKYVLEDPIRDIKVKNLESASVGVDGNYDFASAKRFSKTTPEFGGPGSSINEQEAAKAYYYLSKNVDVNKEVLGHPYGEFGNIHGFVGAKNAVDSSRFNRSEGVIVFGTPKKFSSSLGPASVPHEFNHLKMSRYLSLSTSKDGGLRQRGESYAISEGLADAEQKLFKHRHSLERLEIDNAWTVDDKNTVGPGVRRHMDQPSKDGISYDVYDPSNFASAEASKEEHIRQAYRNAGLVSQVYKLASVGGTNAVTNLGVQKPIGISNASRVIDKASRSLTHNSGFADLRSAIMKAAEELDPPKQPGTVSPTMRAFRDAMNAVKYPHSPSTPVKIPLSEKSLVHTGFDPQGMEAPRTAPGLHWSKALTKNKFMGEGINGGFFALSLLHNVPTLMSSQSSAAEKQQAAAGLAATGGLTAGLSPTIQSQLSRLLQGPAQQTFLKYGSKATRLGGPLLGGVGLGFSLLDTKNTFEKPEATFADKATAVTNNVGMSLAMVPAVPVTLFGLGLFAFSELGGVKYLAEQLPDEAKKWFGG